MNDQVRDAAVRLAASLGYDTEPEWFGSNECWELFHHLMSMMNDGRQLSAASLGFLEELFIVVKVRGADEVQVFERLEAQLGRSPYPRMAVISVVRFVRAQLHFHRRHQQVELHPERRYVPLKSFKFE